MTGASRPGLLVDTAWLAAHLGDPALRVFDATTHLVPEPPGFRVESARPDWAHGHIPGAGFLDLQGELSDVTSPFRFMMPTASAFAAAMSACGVGPGTHVVVYSARSNYWATRIWWMLRAFGFDDVSVLDGGWEKWAAEGRPVCATPCGHPPARFVAAPRPALVATRREVEAAVAAGGSCLVNALTRQSFAGKSEIHYGRPGRIPTSVSLPYLDLVDPATNTFLPPAELRARVEATGAVTAGKVIAYCGAGIAATAIAFALALLGRDDVAVYDGSMSEWCADPAAPVETGEPSA
jgi:thiosulfate/3-mercaptopyruvate sulfurtransferase